MYEQQQPTGAIAVTARYWWMSFLLGLFKPLLAINGHPVQAAWGRTVVPMPPGQHHVHMHIPYLLPSRIGNADTVVTVHPGQVVELEYRAPAIAWLDGAIGAPPQNHNGKTAAIVLVALPLVVLILCLCGGIAISLFSDGNSDDEVTLPAPVRTFPAAEPFEPAPTSEAPDPDKPALRDIPSRTLVGPAKGRYTLDLSHFFGTGGGEPKWQVGVGAFTPPATKANIQKIFNDVLTQTG
ncbi:hypothetical protein [Actinoplanes sp. NBRC 103695]|uniref:hypothetical protein n=1 Tax=Actinoplanes sp. NBRC 103695 TaxID=3032202 RepID=UPI00249FC986|nr:hypothetical protein [Actinoplanes sp. NBRC 103695]GLY97423.1 hypothetical protein Acsp02_46770 [Actinoplanes sp. NBRC 103695]